MEAYGSFRCRDHIGGSYISKKINVDIASTATETSSTASSQVTVRTTAKDGPPATAGTLATSGMPTGMLPKARTQKKRQQQKRKNNGIRLKKEKPQIFSPTSRRRVR
jgi:hypothetical protein